MSVSQLAGRVSLVDADLFFIALRVVHAVIVERHYFNAILLLATLPRGEVLFLKMGEEVFLLSGTINALLEVIFTQINHNA